MAENHNFNVNVAKLYGVNCALILQNIWFWVKHNEKIGANFFDGVYWVYQSTKTLEEIFPYLTHKQIVLAIRKLRSEEIILAKNYNRAKYDRTLWYSVSEKGKKLLLDNDIDGSNKDECISPESQIDMAEKGNSFCPTGKTEMPSKSNATASEVKPIPDIEEDIEKDIRNKISTGGENEKKYASPPRAPLRHKFGQYQNVLLSDDELEKLKEEFPLDYEERIDNLSGYIASTGRTYKNYLATIRNWAREDERRGMNRNGKRGNGSFKESKLPVTFKYGETLGY